MNPLSTLLLDLDVAAAIDTALVTEAPAATLVPTFKIDASAIGKVARITRLKSKEASDLLLEVGAGDLTCTATTTKCDFTVACTVPLRDAVFGRRFAFRIDGDVIARIGAVFYGPMSFTFDAEDATLRWCTDQGRGAYSATAVPMEPADASVASARTTIATLPVTALTDAVRYASLFASEALRGRSPFDGLRIGGRSSTSGYAHALVKYASPAIPHELDVVLPLHNAGNLKTVFAKLSGPVEIATTDASVHLRTSDATISWIKDGRWPASMDRAFQLPVKASLTLQTADLRNATLALSIAVERVEIRVEQGDDGFGRLILSGYSISATGVTPISPWLPLAELPTDIWTFSLSVADLLTSVLAVQTDHVILDVIDRGIYLRSRAPGFETTAILLGMQLS